MWTQELDAVLAAPFAAFELHPDGARLIFADLDRACGWMLDRKGVRRLSLRDTHLVWGAEAAEQRAAVSVDLRDGDVVAESWRLVTETQNAAAVLATLRVVRAARRAAA